MGLKLKDKFFQSQTPYKSLSLVAESGRGYPGTSGVWPGHPDDMLCHGQLQLRRQQFRPARHLGRFQLGRSRVPAQQQTSSGNDPGQVYRPSDWSLGGQVPPDRLLPVDTSQRLVSTTGAVAPATLCHLHAPVWAVLQGKTSKTQPERTLFIKD